MILAVCLLAVQYCSGKLIFPRDIQVKFSHARIPYQKNQLSVLPTHKNNSWHFQVNTPAVLLPLEKVNHSSDLKETESYGEDYPSDLMQLIVSMGVAIDHIPSLRDIGKLLGTSSPDETRSVIRNLVKSPEGVNIIKRFIKSFLIDESVELVDGKKQHAEIVTDVNVQSTSTQYLVQNSNVKSLIKSVNPKAKTALALPFYGTPNRPGFTLNYEKGKRQLFVIPIFRLSVINRKAHTQGIINTPRLTKENVSNRNNFSLNTAINENTASKDTYNDSHFDSYIARDQTHTQNDQFNNMPSRHSTFEYILHMSSHNAHGSVINSLDDIAEEAASEQKIIHVELPQASAPVTTSTVQSTDESNSFDGNNYATSNVIGKPQRIGGIKDEAYATGLIHRADASAINFPIRA